MKKSVKKWIEDRRLTREVLVVFENIQLSEEKIQYNQIKIPAPAGYFGKGGYTKQRANYLTNEQMNRIQAALAAQINIYK